MKLFTLSIAALSIAAGGSAMAQDGVPHNRAGQPLIQNGGASPAGEAHNRAGQVVGGQVVGGQPAGPAGGQFQRRDQVQQRDRLQQRNGGGDRFGGQQRSQGGPPTQAPDRDRRFDGGGRDNQRFGPDRRYDDRRFDNGRGYGDNWNGRDFRDQQRFRAPHYRFPRGLAYRPWGFGEFLPDPFFVRDYEIYDYWRYGLPAPPPGFRWIRVGPDALLARGDGYILDVRRNLFW